MLRGKNSLALLNSAMLFDKNLNRRIDEMASNESSEPCTEEANKWLVSKPGTNLSTR